MGPKSGGSQPLLMQAFWGAGGGVCSLQSRPWRQQSAPEGSELRPKRVCPAIPRPTLVPALAQPAYPCSLPSPGCWSSSPSSCDAKPAHTPRLPRSPWLCGLGLLSGGFSTASSSTHRTPMSHLPVPPRASSGAGPRAQLHSMWQRGLCSSSPRGFAGL